MFEKLESVVDKYNELTKVVADPDVIANQSVWQQHMKEMGEMEPIVRKYQEYKAANLPNSRAFSSPIFTPRPH